MADLPYFKEPMITINNELLKEAIEADISEKGSKEKSAVITADTTPYTLDRVMEGNTDMNLATIGKVATKFGFITEINFIPAK